MGTPLVSVVIDTFNHERYIERCVLSAVEQDFPAADYEIIVIDDGSADGTANIVKRFGPRVRLVSKKNGGQASAFNRGFRESRGDAIAFLDGDDWFAPGKLTAVMEALERNPQVAAATHGHYKFHEESGEMKECVPEADALVNLSSVSAAREAGGAAKFLLVGGITVRRGMLEKIMPIPEELFFCADAPITLGSLTQGVCVLNQPLFHYRHHSNNLYASRADSRDRMRRRAEMIERAFAVVEAIFTRLGVPADSIRAFLYPPWLMESRAALKEFGGSRVKTLRNEMRAFRLDHEHPALAYRLYKYSVVGGATLVLPPQLFYRVREWYGRNNLGRIREQVAGSGR